MSEVDWECRECDKAVEEDDVIVICHDCLGRHNKLFFEHRTMLANLTATQARCTELLEDVRRLKAIAEPRAARSDYRDWDYQDLVDREKP